MRAAVILLAITSACTSCVHTGPKTPEGPAMSLVGRFGFAHACPVDGRILTAAHVAEDWFPGHPAREKAYAWQQGVREGTVVNRTAYEDRDLADLLLVSGEPFYFTRAAEPPEKGDVIYWFEYSYSPLRVVRRRGRVTGIIAEHVSFYPAGVQGASGTCLFNTSGEVFGILTWTYGKKYGLGPLITGP